MFHSQRMLSVRVSCVEDNGGANWPIDSGGESSLQTGNYNKK